MKLNETKGKITLGLTFIGVDEDVTKINTPLGKIIIFRALSNEFIELAGPSINSQIEAYNLGSQVPNEEFIEKAVELNADVLLVSQTLTQKNIHIENLLKM